MPADVFAQRYFACASIEFSTNSAIAFNGLLCESAIIRIAFQSSPMRSLPLSVLTLNFHAERSDQAGARLGFNTRGWDS